MVSYDFMRQLAARHHYATFTDLQEDAFRNPDVLRDDRDVFVIGETSSGKTLIPLLLYEAALETALQNGEDTPKMLFVVPYRALAAQKLEEMRAYFPDKNLKIIQSTGEFRQDDLAIQRGEVDIAIVIAEKVYKYEARDSGFLSLFDFLVLDEIGLISNGDRGVRMDFVLAWAVNQKRQLGNPRIIALGTPFFDWSAYIRSYRFVEVRTKKRPVPLSEITAVYSKQGIESVEGECGFLRRVRLITQKELIAMHKKYEVPGTLCPWLGGETVCPFEKTCRSDPSVMCEHIGRPCTETIEILPDKKRALSKYLLLKICRHHLEKGHQILVFINDRERVKEYCSFLYQNVQDFLVPEVLSPEESKRRLLAECDGLESEDVFGIMEYDDGKSFETDFYQAFLRGVAFHSAALPNELRTYVEQKLLNSRDMKIVCSTETLAFGVNSSVDAVIVADLLKHTHEGVRLLSLNEYQNYAGRAGRLRVGTDAADIKGYVYTLVNKTRMEDWVTLQESAQHPEKLYSLFHSDQTQCMPFFLLNLMPSSGGSGVTARQLMEAVQDLPQDGSMSPEELRTRIQESIAYLVQQKLARKYTPSAGPKGRLKKKAVTTETQYCATDLGQRLRGFIIGRDDYRQLLWALEKYVSGVFTQPDRALFLYQLLCTKHAERGLNTIFYDSESRMNLDDLRSYILQYTSDDSGYHDWLENCSNARQLSILAALLAWSNGESAKVLYRKFGIHYALLNKLAEQIAYLIEIGQELLPSQLDRIWQEREPMFRQFGISYESFLDAMDEKLGEIHNLFVSVLYGVNTDISQALLTYLDPRVDTDADAAALRETLDLHHINPMTARRLRRIVLRYQFFARPPQVDWSDVEARNNYLDQRRQYKKDIDSWGPLISGFFREKLGRALTD